MYYSSYVRFSAVLSIIAWAILTALFVALLGPGGFLLGVLFGFVVLFGFALSVAWAKRAVETFGGSPFPGIWGVFGVTIEADPGAAPRTASPPLGASAAAPTGRSEYAPWSESPPSFRGPDAGLSLADVHSCGRCGTITTGASSKYCRSCRASLDGAEGIETTPAVGCPKCGAVTSGRASRFCRVCGTPLP